MRSDPLVIGSVKSNIGHLESSSALAAIVKTVMSLEREKIPPQLNLDQFNPDIDFSRLKVPMRMLEWPSVGLDKPRVAAVNSFGAGGTNGHAVLQQYKLPSRKSCRRLERPMVFKISAHTEKALQQMKEKLAAYCEREHPDLRQLSYTLGSRRSTMAKTVYLNAQSHEDLSQQLQNNSLKPYLKSGETSPEVVLIFTGQGAQWPGMGLELLRSSSLFQSVVKDCQEALDSLPDRPLWKLAEELSRSAETSNLYKSAFSQPLCTVLQLGLVKLLRFWKLNMSAVVGHSSGEIPAAYAAGMLSLRDAVVIAYYRGLYLGSLESQAAKGSSRGSMLAMNVSKDEATELVYPFDGRVQIAAVNSPSNCTLSGDADAIQSILQTSRQKDIFCRELRVDTGKLADPSIGSLLTYKAFHSHHVVPAAGRYEQALRNAGISSTDFAHCNMFSSVTGRLVSSEELTPDYWARNMVQPVLFSDALTECLQHFKSVPVCVEVGPHPALRVPATDTARPLGIDILEYFPCCIRGRPTFDSLLEAVGALLGHRIELDLDKINNAEDDPNAPLPRVLADLPTYPWDHSASFWFESDVSKAVRFRKHRRHLILGSRALDDSELSPCWRNHLRLDEVPILKTMLDESQVRL